jgi:acetoin utilization deacetylase AcuC-like enzyme
MRLAFRAASRAQQSCRARDLARRRDGAVTNHNTRRAYAVSAASAPNVAREAMNIYYADWATVTLPAGHRYVVTFCNLRHGHARLTTLLCECRFPMDKYAATRNALANDLQLRDKICLLPSPECSRLDLLTTHDQAYVDRVLNLELTEDDVRKIGFPMKRENVVRSLASTGGTIQCARDALRGGGALGRPRAAAQIAGGTHHAFRDRGEGFCVFNDIAVAINVIRGDPMYEASLRGRKILIIDLDVHQGNGSAKIFENDEQVITFSMHGERNYPLKTRETSTHDVELPDDCDDATYLAELNTWLPRLFIEYDPALVFFQAGIDALREDSFGRLAMTRAGMLTRNHAVYSQCITRDLPLVITMGGGYSKPIDASLDAHVDVFRSAAMRYGAP